MKYKQQLKNNIHLIIAFAILIIVATFSLNKDSEALAAERPVDVDTIIPKGYVLVPLDLENKEAISSVIQNFGIIDLFRGNPNTGKARRIASRIKIIRAPYNPHLFAALVKENLSERIMQESGSFFAVIQNKTETEGANELETLKPKKMIAIEYQQ